MTEEKTQIVRLIRKSNELVEGRYKFDMWETRVFTKMVSMIRRDDKDFKDYRIYIKDVMEEYGFDNSKSTYQRIKIGAEKLMRKIIRTVGEDENGELIELTTPIVAGIQNPVSVREDGAYVEVSFHPKMKPLLLQLQSRFTTYDIRNVLRLPSTYSTRIYELLKQYEKIGKRSIDLDTLKEMVGVIELVRKGDKEVFEDTYPLYGNFKQKVILKAQRDLEKYTDIRFDFEPVKTGRRVTGLKFRIYKNTPERERSNQPQSSTTPQNEELFAKVYDQAKDWEHITEKRLRGVIAKYSPHTILAALAQTKEDYEERKNSRNPVRSRGKYFFSLAEVPTLFDERQEEEQSKKKEEERRKKIENEHQAVLDARSKRRKEMFEKEEQRVEEILADEEDLIDKVIEEVKRTRPVLAEMSREEILKYHMFHRWCHTIVKKMRPERFKDLYDSVKDEVK